MVRWWKQGKYNAQIYPRSELCEFKWANIHNKCVHDSMWLANSSPMSYVAALHLVPNSN